ncbi:hypothetical protein ACWECW_11590 [Rhodococcus ruber]
MVTEPLSFLVEPGEEQVPVFDVLEHGLGVPAAGQGGGQGCARAFADRGGQQEVEQVRFEAVEDVFGEVLAEGAMPARQLADDRPGVMVFA